MTIGKAIRSARESKGISRYKVAIKTGIGYQAIVNWELDKTSPRIDLLICVADVLGVTLDELVGRSVPNAKQTNN